MKYWVVAVFCVFASFGLTGQILSPAAYFNTEYPLQFVRHDQVLQYLRYVAEQSPQVVYKVYGQTVEGRELAVVIVSSKANIQNLERIRRDHLRRAGLEPGRSRRHGGVPIVMVNCGIHGNETSATESAMEILYRLVTEPEDVLAQSVILINPSLNPDGFDKFVTWYLSVAHAVEMPIPQSHEHHESWPTSRTNHYLFDLNRDWAWAEQPETVAMLKLYHQWMPHIVMDLHEQHPDAHSFFPPVVTPIHAYVTEGQRRLYTRIGEQIARAFDRHKWLYFTGETFDLFYPGYGDTYPTFNGAVGMTFEQPGHGIAGRSYLMANGDTLRMADRIMRHTTTVLAVLDFVRTHAAEVTTSFEDFFKQSAGRFTKTYIIPRAAADARRLRRLVRLLDLHHIRYGSVKQSQRLKGFDYFTHSRHGFDLMPGDLVIPAAQAMGTLVSVLFDPAPDLENKETYDITAWALPYAYNLPAYAVDEKIEVQEAFPEPESPPVTGAGQYAWLVDWNDAAVRFLAGALQEGISLRYLQDSVEISGRWFAPGTLVITADDNRHLSGDTLARRLERLAGRYQAGLRAVSTGFTTHGPDLGSRRVKLIAPPRIAVFWSPGANRYSYGEIWHFLDVELAYPFVALELNRDNLKKIWDYNTILIPSGRYQKLWKRDLTYLDSWVKRGGNLILFGDACDFFDRLEELKLVKGKELAGEEQDGVRYSYRDRMSPDSLMTVPGGIVRVDLDPTHPLAYGYRPVYYSLRRGVSRVMPLSKGDNVGVVSDPPLVIGHFGAKVREQLGGKVVVAVRPRSDGRIVYFVDDPLFRGFWKGGELFVANALFFR